MSTNQNVAIIGAGNLGIAIAEGLINKQLRKPSEVFLTRRRPDSNGEMAQQGFQVTADNILATRQSKIIFLCVQPKQLPALLSELDPVIEDHHILVSVITGVSIDEIKSHLTKDVALIRAMPNTAVAIGQSMTCMCSCPKGKKHIEEVTELFNAVGKTLLIEEALMKSATVLGASGIAFFMRYLRAATQGGIQMGFHPEEAQTIAAQTAFGAASLIAEFNNHPEVEIDKVTTPRGCTISGLNEMEHSGFSSALIKGLMVSFNRINGITDN
ncbi:MAG: pyrroline-5-carboxylate reductase [Cyclobacteriaceae bacterium]